MPIICKKCFNGFHVEKEEVDIEAGTVCCLTCRNIIDVGLLYYLSKIRKDIQIRYKNSGRKVTNVEIKHKSLNNILC